MQIKSPYYRVSVKAKINFNGKILLVREDGKKWDLPGGGVEHYETIDEALKRELTEELDVSDFIITSGPKIFKMIDVAANRPLIFIVYELKLNPTTEFHPSDNVEIGLFESEKIQDTVSYSPDYVDYIKGII
ncbi:NUDIX domain-containing protein [Candidatus Saccharibacteria bacterium]|nr:NUDIX domain-containing protein [Candidatus Saccharibacteria bacterium]